MDRTEPNNNGVANGFNLQRLACGDQNFHIVPRTRYWDGHLSNHHGLGGTAVVNLDGSEQTIQDLLDEINSKGLALLAQVNATGDGIELVEQLPDGTSSFRTIQVDALSGSAARTWVWLVRPVKLEPLSKDVGNTSSTLIPQTPWSLVEKIDASGAVQAGLVNVMGCPPGGCP